MLPGRPEWLSSRMGKGLLGDAIRGILIPSACQKGCIAEGCVAEGCMAEGCMAEGCLAEGCWEESRRLDAAKAIDLHLGKQRSPSRG
jgi:hypothetical protein